MNDALMHVPIAGRPGLYAVVDAADYATVAAQTWFLSAGVYAISSRRNGAKATYMHRVIIGAPEGIDVDHINGDRLDNRRGNLRLATRSENMRNATLRRNNTSGFVGVSWNGRRGKWVARLKVGARHLNAGYFNDAASAARARDAAARTHYGEFATFNYPRDGERPARVTPE